MRHERVAVLGVPMPDEEFNVRDRMSRTIPGVGDCPQRDGCMLAVRDLIDEMRREFQGEMKETRGEVREMRRVLDLWLGSKGIRNTDSTPTKGSIAVEAGPVKFRGKAWLIVVVLLALGAMAAGAYVLGEWGRPTATVAPK